MKSLDAAKKAPVKSSKKKTVRKKKNLQPAVKKEVSKKQPMNKDTRYTLMWVLVVCFMVVVVVSWVFFLRNSLGSDLSKRGGGFDEIASSFSRLIHTVDRKFVDVQEAYSDFQDLQMGLIDEDGESEEIQELRKKVFPQFENINTNSNI